jgi:hypothetical protein
MRRLRTRDGTTVRVGDTAQLTGVGSTGADGDPLNGLVDCVLADRQHVATVVTNTVATTFTVDQPGTYVIQLVVNDGFVNSVASTVTISTTNSAGRECWSRPDGGRRQHGCADGSGSTDVDHDMLIYLWRPCRRLPAARRRVGYQTAVQPTFVMDLPGAYVVQLIVNDGTA